MALPPTVPLIVWNDVPDFVTCGSGYISWTVVGDPSSLSLFAANAASNFTIVSNIDPSEGLFFWSPVDVTAGNYIIDAHFNGDTSSSPQFLVATGRDTSCLAVPNPSQNPSSTLPSPSPIPSPLPSSISSPSSSSSSSSSFLPFSAATDNQAPATSSTGVVVPIGAISQTTDHAGPIAGGIIGGLALIGLAIVGLLLFIRFRRKAQSRELYDTMVDGKGSSGSGGKWSGLTSKDSGLHHTLPVTTRDIGPPMQSRRGSGAASVHSEVSTLADEDKTREGYLSTAGAATSETHNQLNGSARRSKPPSPAASIRSQDTHYSRNGGLPRLETAPTIVWDVTAPVAVPAPSPASANSHNYSFDARVLSVDIPSPSLTPISTSPDIPVPLSPRRGATRKPVPKYKTPAIDMTTSLQRERSATSGGHSARPLVGLNNATALAASPIIAATRSKDDLQLMLSLSRGSSLTDNRHPGVHYLIPDQPMPVQD